MRFQMKTAVTAALMMLTWVATTNGQTIVVGPENHETAFGPDAVIRISSLFRTAVVLKEGQIVPEGTALEAARRELYQMAANECQTLSQIKCRLSSVTITGVFPNSNQAPQNTVSANANYQLRPKSGR